ncbi:MAG: universal stress protein [Bacteroidia bacterium]|nr:universal stress protein [Bacteroidia bacterium]NNC85381.1 universal stress protein [Bacteroidia bacterium]NNM16827.1 universal stress protein [Bacteroidia bacterium]
MDNLIIPTEFSKESLQTVDMAIHMANVMGADITMVYVQKKRENAHPTKMDEELEYARKRFDEIVEEYKGKMNKPDGLKYAIKKGVVYQEVNKVAWDLENPIILTPTHGASGFDPLFLGDNAYKIVSYATGPVITIRHGEIHPNIKTIVMPMDKSRETVEKIPATIAFAKKFNAKVHIVSISSHHLSEIKDKMNTLTEKVMKQFTDEGIEYECEFLIGNNLANMTIDYAKEVDADIICIMSEQKKSESDILGVYAHYIMKNSPIPVLVVPSDKK